uniref:Uncharacterized protein n=2 Tax=Aegilops tauschii subsp. strangulata TaxID=200361 RepID=A0A453K3R7_AEGTS
VEYLRVLPVQLHPLQIRSQKRDSSYLRIFGQPQSTKSSPLKMPRKTTAPNNEVSTRRSALSMASTHAQRGFLYAAAPPPSGTAAFHLVSVSVSSCSWMEVVLFILFLLGLASNLP